MKLYSEEEKRSHVSAWESQEHTPMSVYSREAGIVYGTFKGWVRKYGSSQDQAGKHKSSSDAPRGIGTQAPAGFIPVELDDSAGSGHTPRLEITLSGLTVKIY